VISDDGKFMLFQNGQSGKESGFSIFLYDFEKSAPSK
jgi:Tol biopolymer transport system component